MTSLDLLATLLLIQPRIQLAFWAVNAHCQVMLSFLSTNSPKSFFAGLLSILSLPSLCLCLGLPQHRVQDLALGFVELHEVCMGPPLKPGKVPLDGMLSLQHVDHTAQLGVIGKFAEGALNPTVHAADKDVKQL